MSGAGDSLRGAVRHGGPGRCAAPRGRGLTSDPQRQASGTAGRRLPPATVVGQTEPRRSRGDALSHDEAGGGGGGGGRGGGDGSASSRVRSISLRAQLESRPRKDGVGKPSSRPHSKPPLRCCRTRPEGGQITALSPRSHSGNQPRRGGVRPRTQYIQ